MRLRYAVILLMMIPALTGEASDGSIDERYYYRLTNSYLGEAYSLDTAPNDPNLPMMTKSGNSSGQYWKFTLFNSCGCYRLTNVFLGPERALDTYPAGEHGPFMAPSGNSSGQCWHPTRAADGYVRLTNDYLGNSHSLDTYSDAEHKPFMGETSNASGQLWKLTRLRRQ